MNREDFPEGSVHQIIFDYWTGTKNDIEFEVALLNLPKKDLVDFIREAQGKGRFGQGYIHP